MDYRLRLPGDKEGDELSQLYDWLTRDTTLRHGAEIRLRTDTELDPDPAPPDEPGEGMSTGFDLVQLILDAGSQLVQLALAIVSWRRAQAPEAAVVVEHDGIRVTLPPGADVEAVLRLLRELDDPEDGEQ
ncbi:hypothetical protein AB0L59_03280 [Streptomyces sp. NPDC052109]|uniref:effector-associated constant component EACC1 n=1 Tax=Streptomyces sp. NPDC052109 TaxID=3155527 RepID=UPI00342352A0